MDIPFNLTPPESAAGIERLSPLVRRLVVPNASAFTFTGTCSYILGQDDVAIIDPGPDDHAHIETILRLLGKEKLRQIIITHTHRDHSPAAKILQDLTGAEIIGCAPHFAARALQIGEINRLDASADMEYRPNIETKHGDVFKGKGFTLEAVATPGHTANHLSFALHEENALFSGDHVMAWSTSIVAPPDGSMGAYMASLELLKSREESIYWPGHGGPVTEPQRFLRAVIHHRRAREASILTRLNQGDRTVLALVESVYANLKPQLKGAAALNLFAHLEDLVERGLVACHGAPQMNSEFARVA